MLNFGLLLGGFVINSLKKQLFYVLQVYPTKTLPNKQCTKKESQILCINVTLMPIKLNGNRMHSGDVIFEKVNTVLQLKDLK